MEAAGADRRADAPAAARPGATCGPWSSARPSPRSRSRCRAVRRGLDDDEPFFYPRNFGLFALAPLAAFLAWRRGSARASSGCWRRCSRSARWRPTPTRWPRTRSRIVLTAIHLPIALWLVVGLAYVAGDWRSYRRRMDFIRFTGEWFIYFVLIALGGGVLIAFTVGTFNAIGVDPEAFVQRGCCPAAPWPRSSWRPGSWRRSRASSRTWRRC